MPKNKKYKTTSSDTREDSSCSSSSHISRITTDSSNMTSSAGAYSITADSSAHASSSQTSTSLSKVTHKDWSPVELYRIKATWGRALCESCYKGNIHDVRSIIKHGGNVDVVISVTKTPVIENTDIMHNHVSPPDGRRVFCNRRYKSPLTEAVRGGHLDVINLLIKKGANLNILISYTTENIMPSRLLGTPLPFMFYHQEETPLTLALRYGNENITLRLIDAGADVNKQVARRDTEITEAKGINYESPLHIAVKHSTPTVVKAMLLAGANPDAETYYFSSGRSCCYRSIKTVTPRDLAKKGGCADMIHAFTEVIETGSTSTNEYSSSYTSTNSSSSTCSNTAAMVLFKKHFPGWGSFAFNYIKDSRSEAFCEYCYRGNIADVRFAIEHGGKLDAIAKDYSPPLTVDVMSHHVPPRKGRLLEYSSVCRSPLTEAVRGGHLDVVNLLIKKGANLNILISYKATDLKRFSATYHYIQETPLTLALHLGKEEIALRLVEAGADVNQQIVRKSVDVITGIRMEKNKRENHESPLHIAVMYSTPAIVKAMLVAGADPHLEMDSYDPGGCCSRDIKTVTPREFAKKSGDPEMIRVLTEGIETNSTSTSENFNSYCTSTYSTSSTSSSITSVSFFKAPNVRIHLTRAAQLCQFCYEGNARDVRLAIRRGNNLDAVIPDDNDSLMRAMDVVYHHVAPPNGRHLEYTKRTKSPLTEAVLGGHLDVVNLLIAKGANLDIRVSYTATDIEFLVVTYHHHQEETPLTLALHYGNEEIALRLIEAGANVNQHVVRRDNHITRYKGKNYESPLHIAVRYSTPEIVEAILLAGADPDATTYYYSPASRGCCSRGIKSATPRELAEKSGDSEMIHAFKKVVEMGSSKSY